MALETLDEAGFPLLLKEKLVIVDPFFPPVRVDGTYIYFPNNKLFFLSQLFSPPSFADEL